MNPKTNPNEKPKSDLKARPRAAAKFRAGRNLAMKVPPHQFDATVRFYRDVLGFALIESEAPEAVFEFGANRLWIDRVATVSQAEIWLEIQTDDAGAAARILSQQGVARCDEIEALPAGFQGYWISSPAAIVHLISQDREAFA